MSRYHNRWFNLAVVVCFIDVFMISVNPGLFIVSGFFMLFGAIYHGGICSRCTPQSNCGAIAHKDKSDFVEKK